MVTLATFWTNFTKKSQTNQLSLVNMAIPLENFFTFY